VHGSWLADEDPSAAQHSTEEIMRLHVVCVFGALVTALSSSQVQHPRETTSTGVPLVHRFLSAREGRLVSYRAVRTLHAEARGGKLRATMKATTSLDPRGGFSYEVIEERVDRA
jgi:hypothetical protein